MSQTELQAACEALEREHPGRVFWGDMEDPLDGPYRVGSGVDGADPRHNRMTGWCPSASVAAAEMRFLLTKAVRK